MQIRGTQSAVLTIITTSQTGNKCQCQSDARKRHTLLRSEILLGKF